MADSTIIIPEYCHPNFLATCLRGLINNSLLKHRILIVGSNQKKIDGEYKVNDFVVNKKMEWSRPYSSVEEYVEKNSEWLAEHNIEYLDVTEESLQFREQYKMGKVFPPKNNFEGGVDIAFKNNIGITNTKTPWVITNWDDDFYPSFGWDLHLFSIADLNTEGLVYIPTHVQPTYFNTIPNWNDIWTDSRSISCHKIAIPTNRPPLSVPDGNVNREPLSITEKEFFSFCNNGGRPGTFKEQCGKRAILH